ncbi:10277_t:CDS:2, partial [Dentiscutata heterogama]
EEVEKWMQTNVIKFLQDNADEDKLDLNDDDITKIKNNKIKGIAFLEARASGKSTRVHQIQKQLNDEGYICIYVFLEQINIKSVDNFWHTLGSHLYLDVSKYIRLDSINSSNNFDLVFQKSKWKNRTKENYAIWFVVAIGPFSILYLNLNNFTTSLFNVNEPFKNPNFTLEQVQFLYKEFEDEYNLTIDQEVIEDIYTQTNG